MGYHTDFSGKFIIDREVDGDTFALLRGLALTRRMKRNVDPVYGVEGEFFISGTGFMGQDRDDTVIDHNSPPSTQPSLWCQWLISDNKKEIAWDEGEKFYSYVEWIKYIIEKILAPRGYSLSGKVSWEGEDWGDTGTILIEDNKVSVSYDREMDRDSW
jgi:hypothetical protein